MDEYGEFQDAYSPNAELAIFGGVVRFDPDGIYLHTNGAHVSIGIKSVEIEASSGMLLVTNEPVGPIVTCGAFGDETLSARGIIGGPSGGNVYTRFRFHAEGFGPLDLRDPSHYAFIEGSASNVWLFWVLVKKRGEPGPTIQDQINAIVETISEMASHIPGYVANFNAQNSGKLISEFNAQSGSDRIEDFNEANKLPNTEAT